MVTLVKQNLKKSTDFNDEFEKYLNKQRLNATFNGLEVAEFSWYKKILGIKE